VRQHEYKHQTTPCFRSSTIQVYMLFAIRGRTSPAFLSLLGQLAHTPCGILTQEHQSPDTSRLPQRTRRTKDSTSHSVAPLQTSHNTLKNVEITGPSLELISPQRKRKMTTSNLRPDVHAHSAVKPPSRSQPKSLHWASQITPHRRGKTSSPYLPKRSTTFAVKVTSPSSMSATTTSRV
jgi:hypothetical protein